MPIVSTATIGRVSSPTEPVSRRSRPAKAPLSRRAILDATMALIREHGVESLTLRDVAAAVETGPASLYAYFDNRDVLLEWALDAAYADVALVDAADGDWRRALAGTIANTIDTLASYPGLATVAFGTIPRRPGALRLAEHELALMDLGGLASDTAALAVDVISQFVAATAVEGTPRPGVGRSDRGRQEAKAAYGADPELFPRVARLADALTGPDERARRDFGIQVILSGLATTPSPPSPVGLDA